MNPRIKDWLKQSRVETPILVIDLEVIRQKYRDFQIAFPHTDIHYAVKANPHFDILRRLAKEGSHFYVSSPIELDTLMQTGVNPLNISYSHTIKKAIDIAYAWQHGVRNFSFDSLEELEKIAKNAPYSNVFCRLNLSPSSFHTGCSLHDAESLMIKAASLKLNPIGLSFHLGAMQTHIEVYLNALDLMLPLYNHLKSKDIHLQKINIGGGFAVDYGQKNIDIPLYGKKITQKAHQLFGENKLIIEPGRSLVAESGTMVAEIILINKKASQIYLDVGYYNGLKEVTSRNIQYPIQTDRRLKNLKSYSLFGLSGDANDRLYKEIYLPSELKEGDRVYINYTGAYTTSAESFSSQGFILPRTVCLPVAEDMPLFAQKVINLSEARTGRRKKSLWG